MGVARFERAISASQTQNHTKLDHTPSEQNNCPNLSVIDYYDFNNIQNKLIRCRLKIILKQEKLLVK